MNISIEKITNGYVVTIEGVKTFCDVPEAICGLTSEAVLNECERLDKTPTKTTRKTSLIPVEHFDELYKAMYQQAMLKPHLTAAANMIPPTTTEGQD